MKQRTIKCARCGNDVVATGMKQKYCPECAYIIGREKAKERVALFREALQAARESGKGGKKRSLVKPEEPKLKHITCAKCNADVIVPAKAGRAKYCPKCAQEEKQASQKRSKARTKTDGETVTAICNNCGLEFSYIYRGYYKALCGECRGANHGAGGPKKIRAKKKKPHVSQIDAIQRAAQAVGMSYGKYKAWLDSQKRKGAKAT